MNSRDKQEGAPPALVPVLVLMLVLMAVHVVAATPAHAARSLAVLALDQGAGSEQYAGLGTALAGMLISDLAQVEDLQLVERQRLDDVLAELELADRGFVDDNTAQRLGRGVGAELVLTGSYSVVGETFLLDARIIEVETAHVLQAVDSQGTVVDFVTVEKDLVEALLVQLDISISSSARRRVLGAAPTERFDAFAAYGEGLEHQAAGRIEQARASFGNAVALDPEFVEAREAMSSLRRLVEQERARDSRARADSREAQLQVVVDVVPDEMTRGDDFDDDVGSIALFGLRLVALQQQQRYCTAYDEMGHFLERSDWIVTKPSPRKGHDLRETTMLAAMDMGLIEHQDNLSLSARGWFEVHDIPVLFRDTSRFILDLDYGEPGNDSSRGYLAMTQRCLSPAEQVDEVDRVLRQLRAANQADVEVDQYTPGITLADHVELIGAFVRARNFGVDAEVQRITEGVLARHAGDEARRWIVARTDHIVQAGTLWDIRRVARVGLTAEELSTIVRALALDEPGVVSTGSPMCATAVELSRPQAERSWENHLGKLDTRNQRWIDSSIDPFGGIVAPLLDLGCVDGHAGRFDDAAQIYAWVGGAAERARSDRAGDESCVKGLQAVPQMVDPAKLASMSVIESGEEQQAYRVLSWYYSSLVMTRCVDEPALAGQPAAH